MKKVDEIKPIITNLFDNIDKRKIFPDDIPTYKDSKDLKEICDLIYESDINDLETLNFIMPVLRTVALYYKEMIRVPYAINAYEFLLKCGINLCKIHKVSEEDAELLWQDIYECMAARNMYVYDDCEDLVSVLSEVWDPKIIKSVLNESKSTWFENLKRDVVETTPEFLAVIDEVQEIADKKLQENPNLNRWDIIQEELSKRGIKWTSPETLNYGALFD